MQHIRVSHVVLSTEHNLRGGCLDWGNEWFRIAAQEAGGGDLLFIVSPGALRWPGGALLHCCLRPVTFEAVREGCGGGAERRERMPGGGAGQVRGAVSGGYG